MSFYRNDIIHLSELETIKIEYWTKENDKLSDF